MTATVSTLAPGPREPAAARWLASPPFGARSLIIATLVLLCLGWSGSRVEITKPPREVIATIGSSLSISQPTQLGTAAGRVAEAMFPPVISERTDINRIADFDPARLPWLSRIEVERERDVHLNPRTLEIETRFVERRFLVEPLGYLRHVGLKMLETFEIAFWGSLIGILLSFPLCYVAAANYAPNRVAYGAARGVLAFLLAIPELISALFLVLAFGFGPVAGILALGLHSAGFLGKFFAADIENSDPKPQEALLALGASKVKVLVTSVLPQVLPQYVAYALYILDRNVRAATVIGIVGAGGVGQELKGRYDMFNYGHVATILIAIFLTVMILDQFAARVRRRLI